MYTLIVRKHMLNADVPVHIVGPGYPQAWPGQNFQSFLGCGPRGHGALSVLPAGQAATDTVNTARDFP